MTTLRPRWDHVSQRGRRRDRHAHARATCGHKIYHLTCREFGAVEREAAGSCGICHQSGPLSIDHDHRVGARAVRGMVCQRCNSRLQRVDAGVREPDERETAYLATPWYVGAGINGACPADCNNNQHRAWQRPGRGANLRGHG